MKGVLRLTALFVLIWSALIPSAYALTNEEIELRFQQLEQENAALKKKLGQVESVLKQQGIDPANPLIEQRVKAGVDCFFGVKSWHNNAATYRIFIFFFTL